MIRLLIRSDRHVIRSDENPRTVVLSPSQTPRPSGPRHASGRTGFARHIGRNLQALWASKLSLRRRAGTWPKTVSGHQSARLRRAAAPRLRAKQYPRAGCPVNRQLSGRARGARRDLCDQHGTPAPARGAWVDSNESRSRRLRPCRNGCHHRRHGGGLSCRRSPAFHRGGSR